jgi:4-hydroxy-tetrahydrodipicolinate reductase
MSHPMIRVAVAGAAGRMGRCVLELANADTTMDIVAALVPENDPLCGRSIRAGEQEFTATHRLTAPCDVLVDFTVADGTMAWLACCRERRIPMVIGATGHDEKQIAAIQKAAGDIPIVKASNFSVGIQTLLGLIGTIAAGLGPEYDIEIVETHHRNKVDAPSGTALTLLDAIKKSTERSGKSDVVFGRSGPTGARPAGQIGVHALRMGEIVGTHEIHFSGPGETLTITHQAHARTTFAAGALRAARWVAQRPPGLYTTTDVLSSSGD